MTRAAKGATILAGALLKEIDGEEVIAHGKYYVLGVQILRAWVLGALHDQLPCRR